VVGYCGFLSFSLVFLSSRQSAWTNALHSFHSALGESETPFFGVSRKQKREKGGKERHSSQRRTPGSALLWGVWGGGCAGLWASPVVASS
jgi:hypothetical protein